MARVVKLAVRSLIVALSLFPIACRTGPPPARRPNARRPGRCPGRSPGIRRADIQLDRTRVERPGEIYVGEG